jgi:hypothetical protein
VTTSYKLVHYLPDPYTGWRVPVAAVVYDGRSVALVRAPTIPDAVAMGGATAGATLSLVMEGLADVSRFDSLPSSIGPHAVLGDARFIPAGTEDPVVWLAEHLLPRAAKDNHETTTPKSHHRATYGKRFFETWKVEGWVETRPFHPGRDWNAWLGEDRNLKPVSHWVGGRSKLLLMEPIVPTSRDVEKSLSEVSTLFSAYRFQMQEHKEDRATLIAYVLPTRFGGTRVPPIEGAHKVIYTEDTSQRHEFLELIREVGSSSDRQQHIEVE